MPSILNYGSLNFDYVYSVKHFVEAGETISSDSMNIHFGGKGLNQSIAAAAYGAKIFHAGKIGTNGEALKEKLKASGVDVSFISVSNNPNGHAIIQVNESGQNSIILFPGSNREITPNEIDEVLKNFSPEDILILQNEINEIPYIIQAAHKKGMKIVFNPSPITPEIKEYPIEMVSLLILNEIEGKALGGSGSAEQLAVNLRKKYVNTDILITLGSKGSLFYDGEQLITQGIYRANPVDTTGAGDTFTGYFVAALADRKTIKEAMDIASKASALSVSKTGAADSIPNINDVKACDFEYEEYGNA